MRPISVTVSDIMMSSSNSSDPLVRSGARIFHCPHCWAGLRERAGLVQGVLLGGWG